MTRQETIEEILRQLKAMKHARYQFAAGDRERGFVEAQKKAIAIVKSVEVNHE